MDTQIPSDYIALEHAYDPHKQFVVINWCLGNVCNYDCAYCPKGLHDASAGWPNVDTVIEFCQKAISHYRDKKLYFEFTGGEVTLWKDLPVLLDFLKRSDCRVGIITNGSRSLEYWQKLLPLLDHVCISFHPESSKAKHFYDVVELLAKSVRTHVNFMMHPNFFPECIALAYKIKDLEGISMAIQPLTDDMGTDLKLRNPSIFEYTATQTKVLHTQNAFLSKQIKNIRKFESYRGAMSLVKPDGSKKPIAPQRFIAARANSWKGWDCNIGVEQIVVDMSGKIYRGWCHVGGKIGKISDEKINFPQTAINCNKDFCHCNFDIMATKRKPVATTTKTEKLVSNLKQIFWGEAR